MIHTNLSFDDYPLLAIDDFVAASSVVADSEDPDHPVALLTNGLTFDYYASPKIPAGPAIISYPHAIVVNAGAEVTGDYLALVGHNLVGVQVTLETSDDAAAWTIISQFTPVNESIDMAVFTAASAQYWRVSFDIADAQGGTDIRHAQIATMRIGRYLQVQRRIGVGHEPLPLNRDTSYINHTSERGHSLDRKIVRSAFSGEISLQNLTPAWYRSNFDPFVRKARTRWFAFAWRPDTYPAEVVWCQSPRDIRPGNQRANGMMQVSFPINAYHKSGDADEEDEPALVLTSPPYPLKDDDAMAASGQIASLAYRRVFVNYEYIDSAADNSEKLDISGDLIGGSLLTVVQDYEYLNGGAENFESLDVSGDLTAGQLQVVVIDYDNAASFESLDVAGDLTGGQLGQAFFPLDYQYLNGAADDFEALDISGDMTGGSLTTP